MQSHYQQQTSRLGEACIFGEQKNVYGGFTLRSNDVRMCLCHGRKKLTEPSPANVNMMVIARSIRST